VSLGINNTLFTVQTKRAFKRKKTSEKHVVGIRCPYRLTAHEEENLTFLNFSPVFCLCKM
jgi:hypothetical protein